MLHTTIYGTLVRERVGGGGGGGGGGEGEERRNEEGRRGREGEEHAVRFVCKVVNYILQHDNCIYSQ